MKYPLELHLVDKYLCLYEDGTFEWKPEPSYECKIPNNGYGILTIKGVDYSVYLSKAVERTVWMGHNGRTLDGRLIKPSLCTKHTFILEEL